MRCGQEEGETTTRGKDNRLKLLDDEYAIVHCTGYIKVTLLQPCDFHECPNQYFLRSHLLLQVSSLHSYINW